MDIYSSVMWQRWPKEPPTQKEAWRTFLGRLLIMIGIIVFVAIFGGGTPTFF